MDDAGKVLEFAEGIAKDLNEKKKDKNGPKIEIPKNKFLSLARCSGAVINPMAATLGGIVGQEVLKACSGKFTPIQQLFYIDTVESLPPVATNLLFPYAILKYPFDLLPSNLICDQSLLFFE